MSDTTIESNGVTTQYAAQVAGDLERNLKEQELLAAEIATLQGKLAALEQDRSVLLNVRQALGVESAPAPAVPAPREEAEAAPTDAPKKTTAKKTAAKKSAPAARKSADKAAGKTAGKTADKAAGKRTDKTRTAAAESAQPSLVSLVREHLVAQDEPRSAAEVAQSLGQLHPERGIKTTVVRTTLEGLVAKNHAQRSKQGTSVFYTSPDAPSPADEQQQDEGPSA
ncbi:hypothetical protein [Streptomyces sp. NPDC050263]|uniref:hypothetical protein n=1 Tax=Streptomyces sp. NPDC050263 TaxID=3155037 RepID=UPI00341E4952